MVLSAGAVSANKDVAYGGNCEAILRHSDDEGNPNSSTIGRALQVDPRLTPDVYGYVVKCIRI